MDTAKNLNNRPHGVRDSTGAICVCTLVLLIALAMLPACGRKKQAEPEDRPRMETIFSGLIEVKIVVDPAVIRLDREVLMTIISSAPTNIQIRLPPLAGRLQGFTLNGAFDRLPVTENGRTRREHCLRLTPNLSEEYRLAPMAITYLDLSRQPRTEHWFATRPVTFETAALVKGKPPSTIHGLLGPLWVYPTAKTVMLWSLPVLLLIGLVYLLWLASRKIHRAIKLRRMSPRERALHELAELIAEGLVAKKMIKEFYLELTMIVRRYIERAHKVRAPEQTTEEFLTAVTRDPRFSQEVILKLRTFLQSADLVKFAAYHPDPDAVDQALATSRDYIETDEQAIAEK